MIRDESELVVESRPEPAHDTVRIPLPGDDEWIHRVHLGGHHFLAVFRNLLVPVIGFSPANSFGKSFSAYYPIDEIYKVIRSAKPADISPDTCFVAIKLLKEIVDKEKL